MDLNRRSIFIRLAIIASLLSVLTLFVPVLRSDTTTLTGLNITFGKEIANVFNIANANLKFSLLAFLAYLLPIISILTLLFCDSRYTGIYAAIMNFVSLILFALMPRYTNVYNTVLNQSVVNNVTWALEWGAIASIILLVISIILCICHICIGMKKSDHDHNHKHY